jgi:hypothetical protein
MQSGISESPAFPFPGGATQHGIEAGWLRLADLTRVIDRQYAGGLILQPIDPAPLSMHLIPYVLKSLN